METKLSLVPTRVSSSQAKLGKENRPIREFYPKLNVNSSKFDDAKANLNYGNYDQDSSSGSENNSLGHTFLCDFPRAEDYCDMKSVTKTFPHLKDINKDFQLENIHNLKCFIMRSSNEDDIHKAIKYGIWTSTLRSNEFLDDIYQECVIRGVPIYLFYSVVQSGQFSAVGQLSSRVQPKHFQYWWEDQKWLNYFEVKWLFVKDVPYKSFKHLYMDDNTPVVRARDCTSIPIGTAKEMLKIMQNYNSISSIFEAFSYMDVREDMMRYHRGSLTRYNQNQVQHAKPLKEKNVQPKTCASSEPEPFDPLSMSLKEFETMLKFYQKEATKIHEEIEDILREINISQQIIPEDLNDYLPDHQDLKDREKELEEGLEELGAKYQTIISSLSETRAMSQTQIAKNTKKVHELEKIYRDLINGFTKDKENLSFFSQKMSQLSVNLYKYNF